MDEPTPPTTPQPDAAPAATPPETPAPAHRLERTALTCDMKGRSPGWLLLAVALHVAVIGGLALFAFHRQSLAEILAKKKNQRKVSTERVEHLSDTLRDLNLKTLQEKVLTLCGLKREIDGYAKEENRHYREFAQRKIDAIGPGAADALRAVETQNAAVRKDEDEFMAAVEKLAAMPVPADPLTMLETVRAAQGRAWAVDYQQTRAENAIEQALAAVSWKGLTPVIAPMEKLFAAQVGCREVHDKLRDRADNLKWSIEEAQKRAKTVAEKRKYLADTEGDFKKREKALNEGRDALAKMRADADAKKGKADGELRNLTQKAKAEWDKANQQTAAARKAEAAARDEFVKAERGSKAKNNPVKPEQVQEKKKRLDESAAATAKAVAEAEAKKKAFNAAKGAEDKERKEYYKANDACKRQNDLVLKLSREFNELRNPRERAAKDVDWMQKQVDEVCARLKREPREWLEAAKANYAAQAQVWADAAALAKAAAAQPEGQAVIPQCNTDAPVVAAEGVGRLNFYQAYEGARGLEKQIVASFRDIRAAELSMLRELAMPQAVRNVEVPEPGRMRLPSPEAVLRRPRTEAGLEAQKLLIRASLEETDKMIANCNDLLQQLRKDDGNDNVALESDDAPENPSMSEAELVAMLNQETSKQREDAREKVAEVAKQAEAVQKMVEEKKRDDVREETAKAAEAARQTVAELQKQVQKMEQAKTVEEVEKAVKDVEALVKKLETVRDEERKAKEKEKDKRDAESKEFAKEAQKAADLAEDAMVVVQDLADSVRQMAEKAKTPPPADAAAADPAEMLASLKEMLKAQAEPFRPQLQLVAEKTEIALKDENSERPETEQADRLADQALADIEKELQKLEKAEQLPEIAEAAKKIEEIAKATEEVAKLEGAAAQKSAEKQHQEAERKEKDAAAAAQASAQAIQQKMAEAQQQIAAAQQMAAGKPGGGKPEARLAQNKAFERAAAETTAQVADISALMKQANFKDLTKTANQMVRVGTPYPKLTADTPGLAWGRKIVSGKNAQGYQPSSWMVLDSWYVIGPWANPNRVNRDRKLPPENVVDLDATYQGMHGEPLRWQYRTLRVDEPWKGAKDCPAMVMPPKAAEYAIYYFFTEVYCDEERDLWFATTSDDKSKIWINDMLVWESGGELKSVRFGEEGYRKVHLQAGNNRILYRLENGWHGTSFSMCFFINNPAR